MSLKVVISDIQSEHAGFVKTALLAGASGLITTEEAEIRLNGFSTDIAYAQAQGAVGLVRSTTGVSGNITLAKEYYRTHGILTCMPAGSNSPGQVYNSNGGTNLPVIVLTGAGDAANETGDDIEFFAPDVVTVEPDLSSYSNSFIFAQLYRIMIGRDCGWWEARYAARMTASNNGTWHETNGFGLIDVAAAIAFADDIIEDPYLTDPESIITLAPNNVVDAVVARLNANKVALGIKIAVDISEDSKDDDKQLRPPYCAVYANFESDANDYTGDQTPLSIPVEIKILCSSRDNKSASLSFAEAFRLATAVLNVVRGIVTVTQDQQTDEVDLMIRRKPFDILRNSAEQAVVQVNCYYEINAVGV